MLYGFLGNSSTQVNRRVLTYGAGHLPALIIDCANCADVHRLFPGISVEAMAEMYVFELDLLHKFRDVLRRAPLYARQRRVNSIIVTSCDQLIHYQDQNENENIYRHAWQLMRRLSADYPVAVAVVRGRGQDQWARHFCHQFKEEPWGTLSVPNVTLLT